MIFSYTMYLNVFLSLVCLPWILAHIVDGMPCGKQSMPCLPWPRRSLPVLLAAPLLPLGLLTLLLPASHLVHTVHYALYIGPNLFTHVLAALLQTVSVLLTSSLLTASIRDIFHISTDISIEYKKVWSSPVQGFFHNPRRCVDAVHPEANDVTKSWPHTVKKVDEVVRHPHRVTQDQFNLASKKVSGIPEDNFSTNIELFRQTFTNVELLRQNWIVSKVTLPGREPTFSGLHSDTLPLRHTLFLILIYTGG
jgi:hypothetical protein